MIIVTNNNEAKILIIVRRVVELLKILIGIAWGPYMLALIAGTGLYLMLGLKLFPIIKLPFVGV